MVHVAAIRDIADRVRAEEQLQASEARYRNLFFDSPVPLWEEDFTEVQEVLEGLRQDGVSDLEAYLTDHPEVVRQCAAKVRVLNVNDAVLRMHQAASWDEVAALVQETLGSMSQRAFREELVRIFRGETSFDLEVSTATTQNAQIQAIVRWTAAPGYERSLGKVFVAAIDVTEQRAAEERLQRLQVQRSHVARLSMGGELVAGIAHEVNQPLYSILNYANASTRVLESEEPDPESLQTWNRQIAASASRAGEIIRRLREFVGRKEPHKTPVAAQELVRNAVEMLRFEAKQRRIAVREEVPQQRLLIAADPIQIQQVLVNLLYNAYESLESSPSLERGVAVAAKRLDNGVEFSVADNGPGLPPGAVALLFEPFATTKSGGLGMGLAISKTIVESHGGVLLGENNQDGGATFRFTLPSLEYEYEG